MILHLICLETIATAATTIAASVSELANEKVPYSTIE